MQDRTRNWSFILYPESAPENWRVLLKGLMVPVAVSPLHTEREPGNDEEMKPHHHVFLKFDGVKTYKQAKEITDLFNGTIPKTVKSPIGLIRYFVHKDDPEKQQFDFSEIMTFNGFDISAYDSYTDKELESVLVDIIRRIRNDNVVELCDLVDSVVDSGDFDYLAIIRKNVLYLNSYICSRRNKQQQARRDFEREMNNIMWR